MYQHNNTSASTVVASGKSMTPYSSFEKRQGVLLLFVLLSLGACKKDPVLPPPNKPEEITLRYINLNNHVIGWNEYLTLDLNQDNRVDVLFYTQLVGDPILQVDKRQWLVTTTRFAHLAINEQEELPVLGNGKPVPVIDFKGYVWYPGSEGMLMQRTEDIQGNKTWQGPWLNKVKRFLPVQIMINGSRHTGWIEITTDSQTETITLHRAAISTEPEKAVNTAP